MSTAFRIFRKLLTIRLLIYGPIVAATILVSMATMMQTRWGNRVVAQLLEMGAEASLPNLDLEIGGMTLLGWNGVVFENTSVSTVGDAPMFWFKRLSLEWAWDKEFRLFCVLDSPTVEISTTADGGLNWHKLFPPSESTDSTDVQWPTLGFDVSVPIIEIQNGQVELFEQGVALNLDMGAFWKQEDQLDWMLHDIQIVAEELGTFETNSRIVGDGNRLDIAIGLGHKAGSIELNGHIENILSDMSGDLDATWEIEPAAMDFFDSPVGLRKTLTGRFGVQGTGQQLLARLDSNIGLALDATVAPEQEQWNGRLSFNDTVLHQWFDDIEDSVLQGEFGFDGSGFDWQNNLVGSVSGSLVDPVVWNEQLLDVQTAVRLNKGQVVVEQFTIEHPSGRVDLTGSVDALESTGTVRLETKVEDVSSWLPEYSVHAEGVHDINVNWRSEVEAKVNGTLELQDVSDGLGVSIEHGEIQSQGIWKDSALHLENVVTANNTRAVGVELPEVLSDIVLDVLDNGDIQISGVPTIPNLYVGDGTLHLKDLKGGFGFGMTESGPQLKTEDMTVGQLILVPAQYVVDGGSIDFSLKDNQLLADLHLLRKKRTFIQSRAKADLNEGIWSIDRLDFVPIGQEGWSLKDGVSFELTEGGVGDLDLQLVGDAGDIHLVVDQQNSEPDVGVEIQRLDIEYLRALSNAFLGPDTIPIDISGQVFGSIHLLGYKGRFQDGDYLLFKDIKSPDLANYVDVYVDVGGSLERIQTHMSIQHEDQKLVQGTVILPMVEGAPSCEAPVRGHIVQIERNWQELNTWIPVFPDVDMVSSAEIRVDGTACDPVLAIVGQGDVSVGAQGERVRWLATVEHESDRLSGTVQVMDGLYERFHTDIEGRTHLSKMLEGDATVSAFDSITVQMQSRDLYVQRIGRWMGFPDLGRGKIDSSVVIGVTPDDWTLDADISLPKVRLAKHRLSLDSGLQITVAESKLDGTLKLDFLSKGAIEGSVDYDLETDALFSTLDIEQVPATLLSIFVPDIRQEHGKIEGNILVDGTMTEPLINALVGIDDLGFQIPTLGTEYQNINAEVAMENGQLSLQKLDGQARYLNAGPLELTSWGRFGLRSTATYSEDGIQATARLGLDEFPILNTDMAQAVVSGSIKILQASEGLSFEGDAYVHQASVRLGREFFEEGASLALPSDFTIHRNSRSVTQTGAVDDWLDEFWEGVHGSIHVDLGDRVVVHTTMPMTNDYGEAASKISEVRVDAELRGVLDVGWKFGQPDVLGTVNTLRGTFVTMGKEFSLGEGDIVFSGLDVYNPELNLFADKSFGEYGRIGVAVTGSVDEMDLVFESIDSPYPFDQTDIVTLLLLGKPSQELAGSESQTGAVLIQAGLTSMSGAVGDALGGSVVDNVDWDPTEGMFRVGKTLSDTMFLSYMRNYWADEGENINEVTLEWLLLQRVYGEFVTGDANNTQATLYYRWVF